MTEYRSRPTAPNPFGDIDPPYVGELPDVLARGRQGREAGDAPVIEYRAPGTTWMGYHPTVTCDDLRRIGLAREVMQTVIGRTGKAKSETRWKISDGGQRVISEAASADPLDFDLDRYRTRP